MEVMTAAVTSSSLREAFDSWTDRFAGRYRMGVTAAPFYGVCSSSQ